MEGILSGIIFTAILLLYPVWRIHKRAGVNPAASLVILIPYVGMLIAAINLSLSQWNVESEKGVEQ